MAARMIEALLIFLGFADRRKECVHVATERRMKRPSSKATDKMLNESIERFDSTVRERMQK